MQVSVGEMLDIYWLCAWFSFLCKILSATLSILRRIQRDISQMYIDIHVKCPLFLSNFKETLTISTHFRKKCVNIEIHENPSSGNGVVPCGRTEEEAGIAELSVTS